MALLATAVTIGCKSLISGGEDGKGWRLTRGTERYFGGRRRKGSAPVAAGGPQRRDSLYRGPLGDGVLAGWDERTLRKPAPN